MFIKGGNSGHMSVSFFVVVEIRIALLVFQGISRQNMLSL